MFRKRGDISERPGSSHLNEVNSPKTIELSYQRYLVKVCMLTGLPVLVAFTIYDFIIGRYLIGVILFFLSSILISLFLLVNKPNYQVKEIQIYRYFFTSFFILFGFYMVYSIGIEGKLSRIPWSYTFPVVVFFALGARSALVWAGMLFCALLFLGLYYPSNEQMAIHELKLRFYISFLWVIMVSFFFERLRRKSQLDLAEKQQTLKQSENRYREAYEQLSIEVEERKRSETALRASEARFRDLAELLPETVYEMDVQGKITFVSHGAYDIFGYTQHDFDKGVNAFDMLAPEDRGKARENVKKILGGEKSRINEYTTLRKDGTIFPAIILSNAILREGKPVGLRGIIIDITKRKQLEQALSRSEAKYRQIVENAPAGICEVDLTSMRFTKVNDGMCEYLGYTQEELMSMNPFDLLSEEDKRKATERMNKFIAGEDVAPTSEFKLKARGGRELWALINTRILNENGKPARAVTVVHDISERKRVEGQIRHSQKMKAIGTLAGGIAHEFNNALGVLTGNIELMELDLPNNEIIKDYVGSINASTRRMAQLTDQLLAYARGGKYGSEIISLSDFVRKTLPLVKRNVGPGINLETDLAKEPSKVKADETQLKMVLASLLKNASEAIEGEGRIRIKTRVKEIDEDFAQNHLQLNAGRCVSLSVEDDGRGMDEETKAKIFDPFFTTKFQGRGLGMAAIHGIVENHGGWVQVESQLEKGTEVIIYLPLIETAKEKQQQATAEISGDTHTILLVEDDASLVKVIQKNLEKLGYRVLAAKTAAQAVDISRTSDEDISLALLDLGLPDMGGEKLYPLLMEARPDLKVILASGYSAEDTAQQMLDSGAQAFVQKPFSLKTLTAKVDEVLGRL